MTIANSFNPRLGGVSSILCRSLPSHFRPAYQCRPQSPVTALGYASTPESIRYSSSTSSPTPFNHAPRLANRTCMITGGTSGIGYSIAERFLHEGAGRVILVGRSYKRLLDAARRLEGSIPGLIIDSDVATRAPEEDRQQDAGPSGPEAGTAVRQSGALVRSSEKISLLVGDVAEAAGWMRELEREMESTDILINAAGISMSTVLAKCDPEDISRILRTNLEGAILTSRAFVRASLRARIRNRKAQDQNIPFSKCIINISSLLALKSGTGAVPYAASKAGLLGLTRSLAVEAAASLKDVVLRSNAIVPGYIETPMIADFSEAENSRLKESIPLRRFGDPREVADAAVFLAQNEYANNCVLNIDGGLSAV